ncbi:small, acid-soluble spore protein, alpha/beta type [Dorea sp. D27]
MAFPVLSVSVGGYMVKKMIEQQEN